MQVVSENQLTLFRPWIIKLPGLASYLFYQYHCLRMNRVHAEINTFLRHVQKGCS